MAKPLSDEAPVLYLTTAMHAPLGTPEPDTPWRMLLVGDVSGRASRGLVDPSQALALRRPLRIDRDTFDEVFAALGVELALALNRDTAPLRIRFTALDDFHPDRLFARLDVFQPLKQTRQQLANPATFVRAAAAVQRWLSLPQAAAPAVDRAALQTAREEPPSTRGTSLLDDMLTQGQPATPRAERAFSADDLQALVRQFVQPYLVPRVDPTQADLLHYVDTAIGILMRTILHHVDFQSLEATWRAISFLVRGLDSGSTLQLHVYDVSKATLAADLAAAEPLSASCLYHLLVTDAIQTPGAMPWAVVAGDYTFGATQDDIALLRRLAQIALQAGAPFIAAAHAQLLGCTSLAATPDPQEWSAPTDAATQEAWNALRQEPAARYVGLALPRFLLRLPYGQDTAPVEQFSFEEMPAAPEHERYVWGNPSFAGAYLLAHAFSHEGWTFSPGRYLEIEGLPLHVYQRAGAAASTPCAETLLTERAAEAILDRGLMPLLSLKDQDRVRLARFQSLASPLTALAGRWG